MVVILLMMLKKGRKRLERAQTVDGGGLPKVGVMAGLAEKLLQLELELETNCSVGLITALVEQYQQAIELFEHHGDRRYLDLQTRMHKMLMRPDVQVALGCLSPVKEPAPAKVDPPSETRPVVAPVESVQVSRNLTKLFNSQETTSKSTALQVQRDKALQDEQLRARLLQRSSRHSSRKTSPRRRLALDMRLVDEPVDLPVYPFSAQISPRESSTTAGSSEAGEGPFDELEIKLEEVMERSFTHRSQRLAEIKQKYEPELRELEGQTSSLMKQVAEQTKVALERELAEAVRQLDEARRSEVRLLRQQYLSGV